MARIDFLLLFRIAVIFCLICIATINIDLDIFEKIQFFNLLYTPFQGGK